MIPRGEEGFSLQLILIGLIVLVTGALITGLWLRGERAEKKYSNEVAAHAQTMSAHNLAVANAAMETARAERIERESEQAKQEAANAARRKDEEVQAAWKARVDWLIGEHGAKRKQLLNHVERLTNRISTGAASKDPITTIVDLQNRLTICGQFFNRADDIAERAAVRYGEVRNLWDECTRDAKAVREGEPH